MHVKKATRTKRRERRKGKGQFYLIPILHYMKKIRKRKTGGEEGRKKVREIREKRK